MLEILLNKARKHYRRRQVETVTLEEAIEVPENADAPEETVEREEEAHRLRHCAGPIMGQARAEEAQVGLSQSHFR